MSRFSQCQFTGSNLNFLIQTKSLIKTNKNNNILKFRKGTHDGNTTQKIYLFFALVSDSVTDFFPRFVQAKSAQCIQTHLNISTSLTLQNKLILLPTQ